MQKGIKLVDESFEHLEKFFKDQPNYILAQNYLNTAYLYYSL